MATAAADVLALAQREPDAVERALSVPTRAGIYRRLRTQAEPVSAREVADMFGLHPNVARNHLDVLVDAGLAVSSRRRNPAGGRPAKVYVAREQSGPDRSDAVPSGSQLAVRLLVQSLLEAGVGLAAIEQVARDQGATLVQLSGGRADSRGLEAAAVVAVEALRQAFPEARVETTGLGDGDRVAVAGLEVGLRLVGEVDGRVADTLVRGLVTGAVEAAGGTVSVRATAGRVGLAPATAADETDEEPVATVDARGQTYQAGVVATMRTIVPLRPGSLVEVLTDTRGAPAAFARWADRAGHEVVDVGRVRDLSGTEAVRLLVRKAAA